MQTERAKIAWYKWENNIKVELKEIWLENVDWIYLAHDTDQWAGLGNMVMKFPSSIKFREISWLADKILALQARPCSMQLDSLINRTCALPNLQQYLTRHFLFHGSLGHSGTLFSSVEFMHANYH